MKMAFNRSKEIEHEIEKYLHLVQKTAMIFNEGIKEYCNKEFELFEKRYEEITVAERQADELRRHIKYSLYRFMLIPEARGDVLGLLETLDNVLDYAKRIMQSFSIEKPQIYDFLVEDLKKMGHFSRKAIEQMVKASNAFFTDMSHAQEYINKVYFYEHEVDKVEERMKRELFESNHVTKFSEKVYLRDFIEKIAALSDGAEDVCERLSISVIKRSI